MSACRLGGAYFYEISPTSLPGFFRQMFERQVFSQSGEKQGFDVSYKRSYNKLGLKRQFIEGQLREAEKRVKA